MKIGCPECKSENEIEFSDPNLENQNVECVACNAQFIATKDGNSEAQVISQDMAEGETLATDVDQVVDLEQEPGVFEEEPESIESSFDPDNIENMLDQMLEGDVPEVFTDLDEDVETSPLETDSDVTDPNIRDSEPEIEDAPEVVTGQTKVSDANSASPGGDDLENILDGVLEDTSFAGLESDVKDAPEVVTDEIEEAETISAPSGGDDLDSILDGMLTDTSFGDVEGDLEDAPEIEEDPNQVFEEAFPEPSKEDLDNVLDGMLNSEVGEEGVLGSEVEDAPEVVVDPNQEEVEAVSEPPSEEDLDSVLEGMLANDADLSDSDTKEKTPDLLENEPSEIESEKPTEVAATEPIAEKTIETDQNSDMETISPEASEIVDNVDENTEEPEEIEESEESEEDILNSLKEEMGLDDLFSDDIDESGSKPDETIDEQAIQEPENAIEETEASAPVPELTEDEAPQVETKNENSDEIPSQENALEESNAQDDIERMLEENIQEGAEVTQETSQELKEENATVEEKLDEIWDDTVNSSKEVTEDPKENSETNSEDHTVAEEKPEESEDDLWAQAFAEQDDLNKEQEAPKQEEDSGAEGGEDDLWAQAFAEQDDLNKEQEAPKQEEDSGAEGSEEDLWAQAFAEQDELNKDKEAPKEEGSGSEESEEDLWAQAFAEQDELNKEKEPEAAEAVDTVDTAEEDDQAQTAPEEDEAALAVAEEVEDAPEEDEPDTGGIREEDYEDDPDDEDEEDEPDTGGIREEDYEDEDDDEDYEEEEEDEPRRKIGPIPIPSSTLGKALMGASLAAVLITAGGFYFGVQTFMPEEVAKYIPFLKKEAPAEEGEAPKEEGAAETGKEADPNQTEEENPDALSLAMEGEDSSESPKEEMAQKEESGEMKSAETQSETESTPEKPAQQEPAEATPPSDGAAPANQDSQVSAMEKEQPASTETEKPKEKEKPLILGSEENVSEEAKDVSKALQAALGDKGEATVDPDSGLLAALSPTEKTIMFGTIMPVAYNINDIRVLSFDLQVELDNGKTAKLIREALPVYEKIMVDTVEKFLEKKFYNDILYVKEKLQKQLQKNFNKSIKGGRVKKAKFKEFTIQ